MQIAASSRPIDRGLISRFIGSRGFTLASASTSIAQSLLAGLATSELLGPLIGLVRDHVLARSKLHADDTPVLVLVPGTNKENTEGLWIYVHDDRQFNDSVARAMQFAYCSDRKGEHPKQT